MGSRQGNHRHLPLKAVGTHNHITTHSLSLCSVRVKLNQEVQLVFVFKKFIKCRNTAQRFVTLSCCGN